LAEGFGSLNNDGYFSQISGIFCHRLSAFKKIVFDDKPGYLSGSYNPQLYGGRDIVGNEKG
jgi:hypothetical protein